MRFGTHCVTLLSQSVFVSCTSEGHGKRESVIEYRLRVGVSLSCGRERRYGSPRAPSLTHAFPDCHLFKLRKLTAMTIEPGLLSSC